jgi:hypothetical protein
MKTICSILFLLGITLLAMGETPDRYAIDSMHYEIRDFRDSIRLEIRSYKDSIRLERRHRYDSIPHEVRIGWGDQTFESLVWREKAIPETYPNGYMPYHKVNYRYTQHLFAEYLYNVNYWYSFGFIVDYSGVLWDEVPMEGHPQSITEERKGEFHNIGLIPEVRFSYYQSDYVALYSSLGIGLNINTGSELDYKGRKTALAPVVNVSLLGVRVGKGRWYGAVELGAMFSIMGMSEMYMLGSRICTASVGVRL